MKFKKEIGVNMIVNTFIPKYMEKFKCIGQNVLIHIVLVGY